MTTDLSLELADCLEAIERNELTGDECLARYPAQRTSLSELLPVAALLRSARAVVCFLVAMGRLLPTAG